VVLDGTDNLVTRRAAAAACEALHLPLVSGAVSMFSGQLTVFAPHLGGPAHDALYPPSASDDALPSCEASGILGPVTGVIGTMMALEAIKLIVGLGQPLIGRVLVYDARDARFEELTY
jgi:molybdopterin-synthase adenylyltransferase